MSGGGVGWTGDWLTDDVLGEERGGAKEVKVSGKRMRSVGCGLASVIGRCDRGLRKMNDKLLHVLECKYCLLLRKYW